MSGRKAATTNQKGSVNEVDLARLDLAERRGEVPRADVHEPDAFDTRLSGVDAAPRASRFVRSWSRTRMASSGP
jgi:hypothetical protein